MPFSQTTNTHTETYWNNFFEIIKQIMEEIDYDCARSEVGPYKLFSNIVDNIERSDIVVAVLTDFNANVWYELGIRHTLKSGTIMLLQEGQQAPFDIKDFGIIIYPDSIMIESYFRQELKTYIKKINESSCDSPVLYSLGRRVPNSDSTARIEKKLEEMQQLIFKLAGTSSTPRKLDAEHNTDHHQNCLYRVLWVDDYPSNNEVIIDLFEEMNIQFDIAITTKQGIEMFINNDYNLIITDMGRGKERDAGIKLIQKLNLLHCKVPIVVFASTKAVALYRDQALILGASKVTDSVADIINVISKMLKNRNQTI